MINTMQLRSAALVFAILFFAPLNLLAEELNRSKEKPALDAEPVMKVGTLPEQYPRSWLFAHDTNFQSLVTGKVIIVDSAADTKEYKAAIGASQFATFVESKVLPELYVAETFYSRGVSGIRTDVVTVYDKTTLFKKAEIILPGNKRALIVSNKHNMRLLDNDKYLALFNFTPASSVTIIDTKTKEILNDIDLPGCSMIYPNGPRGFSSLCSDGSMVAIQFDQQGQEISRKIIPPFFDINVDPLFDKPSYVDGIAYFISYLGNVVPVDMRGVTPKVLTRWSLLSKKDINNKWRPSGWQVSAGTNGQLYVIMNPNGFDGSHKSGGKRIWVYDIASQERILAIKPTTSAFSLELLNTQPVTLAVTNVLMDIDIYDAKGKLQRTFNLGGGAMPLVLHAVRN